MAHEKRGRTYHFSFDEAIRLMRRHDPQLQEDGFGMLSAHAHEHVERLMAEFHTETNHGLRCWLLELVGEAKSPQALPLLFEYLHSEDDSLRGWARRGLEALDTKESRRALWEAGDDT